LNENNFKYKVKKDQSDYTRENLYNLDSDDDELDFLRKDIDFEDRAEWRKQVRLE